MSALSTGGAATEVPTEEPTKGPDQAPATEQARGYGVVAHSLAEGQFVAQSGGTGGISVVIPLYNHERFIEAAIESVLRQSLTPGEIIVVDDGSTDRSAEILRDLCVAHPEIIFWSQPNQGAHHTINAAIHRATGDFISILNSDDLYRPERLEACWRLMQQEPATSAIFTGVQFLDGDGNPVASPWYEGARAYFREVGDLSLALANANLVVSTSNLFLRRSVFCRVGYFAPLRYAHDLDFCLRLLASGESLAFLEHPLLGYRLHGNNTIAEDRRRIAAEHAAVLAFHLYRRWRSGAESGQWDTYLSQLAKVLESHELSEPFRHLLSDLVGHAQEELLPGPLLLNEELRWYLKATGGNWSTPDPPQHLLASLSTAIEARRGETLADQKAWIAQLEETLADQKTWITRLEEALADQRAWINQLDETLADQRVWIAQLEEAKRWLSEKNQRLGDTVGQRETLIREQKAWAAELEAARAWLSAQNQQLEGTVGEREATINEQKAWIAKLEEAREWLSTQNQWLEGTVGEREAIIEEQKAWIAQLEGAKQWLAGQNERFEADLTAQTRQNLSLQNQIEGAQADLTALQTWIDGLRGSRRWRLLMALGLMPDSEPPRRLQRAAQVQEARIRDAKNSLKTS